MVIVPRETCIGIIGYAAVLWVQASTHDGVGAVRRRGRGVASCRDGGDNPQREVPMTAHLDLDVAALRETIQAAYAEVAEHPDKGFHFHTGRPLARLLGYEDSWLAIVPEESLAAFAGTGNPFSVRTPQPGERVVDVGCGAGIDSLI